MPSWSGDKAYHFPRFVVKLLTVLWPSGKQRITVQMASLLMKTDDRFSLDSQMLN